MDVRPSRVLPTLPDRFSIGPEFAFTVEQLTGSSDLITLIVGGVATVSDGLIDSGATCNVVGQQTWEIKVKNDHCS